MAVHEKRAIANNKMDQAGAAVTETGPKGVQWQRVEKKKKIVCNDREHHVSLKGEMVGGNSVLSQKSYKTVIFQMCCLHDKRMLPKSN